MTIRDIIFILFIVSYSGWALWRSWLDMGRPWPDELTFKQRSTKRAERIIFVTRRH